VTPTFARVLPEGAIVRPRGIRAGTYEVSGTMSPLEIFRALDSPLRPGGVRITIPEGATIWEVSKVLETHGIGDVNEFRRKAFDRTYATSLVGWEAPTLEGYLFPDTYLFEPGTTADAVAARLVRRFHEKWDTRYAAGAAALDVTPHQFVTMASIAEKEAGPAEQPLVSRVLHNRLQRHWKLESCATVIYGLLPGFDGDLRKADLRNPHQYNTYVHDGLPPGPIASPGDAALAAIMHPADGCFLFFVSRNDGSNAFSCSLREHEELVHRYQVK
jgi:UPF0755 protein